MSGEGQVKDHNEAFSHFVAPGRLDRLQRAHTRPKWWVNVHEGYCTSMNVIPKKVKVTVRSQKVTIKEKSQKCRATHVFWVILRADIDGDSLLTLWHYPIWLLMEVRSWSGQIFKSILCFLFRISSGFQICHSFFFVQCVKRRKIASQKLRHQFIAIYYKYFFHMECWFYLW